MRPQGGTTAHDERLRPSVPAWLLVLVGAAMAAASAFPLGAGAAVAAGAVVGAAVVAVLLARSPRVSVDADGLRAGRAFLQARYIGAAQALDPGRTREALGPELRADAFVVHTSWVRTAVRVEVADDADPTPYWLVSTRRPEALARALTACRDQAAHSEQTG